MSQHDRLAQVAHDTLEITARGHYDVAGIRVMLPGIPEMVAGTRVYGPEHHGQLMTALRERRGTRVTAVEVTDEDTLSAARRLQAQGRVAALNFASATRPGGGVLRGARAQEEDLARSSALYASLTSPEAEAYYVANRASNSPLYTDHVIHSPGVPVFRDVHGALLAEPVPVDLLTAPAPNATAIRDTRPTLMRHVKRTLEDRARMVLAVAAATGHTRLVLGAWGCGVFGNDPAAVAEIFRQLLTLDAGGVFDHVTFAVYDPRPPHSTLQTFRAALG